MSGQPAPHHDDTLEPVPHQIIASWPPGTFVENLANITTHVHNTLVRLDPDGRRVALAGPEQGMHGATACAFGVGADDGALFVTTTGGVVMPVDDVPREAKLVRLDVARRGRQLTFRP